jgi:hypothetical protein
VAKALILQGTNFFLEDGVYTICLDVMITSEKLSRRLALKVSSSLVKPLLGWQGIVRDAIVAQAQSELGQSVDEVIFPDFTVLGLI